MNTTSDINDKIGVSILIIGDLDEFASLSIETFRNLNSSRVCYVADELGELWLDRHRLKLNNITFCRHQSNEIVFEILSLGNESKYESFGSQKFFTLMILKWLLILDIWNTHTTLEYVLFSDLDIVWRKSPRIDDIFKNSRQILAIQDDSTSEGRTFYCPGIMIWKKTNQSQFMIKEIYDFQKDEISRGNIIADDKALNAFILKNQIEDLVGVLDKKLFVIGHRFPYLLSGVKEFSLRNYYAFHANYVSGGKLKLIYLRAVLVKPYNPIRYCYVLWYVLRALRR